MSILSIPSLKVVVDELSVRVCSNRGGGSNCGGCDHGDRGCNCRMPVYRLERKICQASLQPKTQTNFEIKIYEINIYRILDGCEEIWILCSSGKNNISRVSAANE